MDSEPTSGASARRSREGIAELRQATATPQWRRWWAPFGRAGQRASAALRSLELARPVLRSRALHLHAARPAESIKTSGQRY